MMRVLTLGTFDLFHLGHVKFLKKCRGYAGHGSEVYIGLNTDKFIEKYKGKPPVMSYKERESMILELDRELNVVPNDQHDGTIDFVVGQVKPKAIIIGSDWARKDYLKQIGITVDYLENKNIDLIYTPYYQLISTTEIKRRVKNV